ncbi:hypothetical protein DVJ83_17955 (plasmid) [Deinococcus wulumuqiensis]|uniref:Uncharacterized protein n=2 Tax=Deinococcus wulumuqiensis TaxID=980427 RepID=A0A345IMR0_9DEIO|nr:hypothetical protein DVJ83_17955 [Deinococcus wulumuqiensis]
MDASGGRHNEADVIRLALQEGWDDAQAQELLEAGQDAADPDVWNDLVQDAAEYLNTVAPEGFTFTSTDGADWGLYPLEDDDA